MIIKFILKHWKKVFDIILVIAIAVAAYFFLTKFMFGTKTKLHTTANMVSSIKDIGELVTAEYYGEVIASLEETELDLISVDSMDQVAYDWYISLKLDVYKIYEDKPNKIFTPTDELDKIVGNIAKKFVPTEQMSSTMQNEIKDKEKTYFDFLNYIRYELGINRYRGDNTTENLTGIAKYLYKEIKKNHRKLSEDDFYDYLYSGVYKSTTFSEYLKEEKRQDLGRKRLSIIGRGWVKAGFDFGKITKDNFYYDKEQKIIHLLGFEPEILDADINPWFIPENKVPGFQIISSKGRVNFKDAQKVKLKCVNKLKEKAVTADILDRAQEYGEETLMAFFSLLVEDDIKKVVLHSDKFDQLYNIVAADSLISYDETELVLKKINHQIKGISKAKIEGLDQEYINKKINLLIDFITKLKGISYGEKDLNVKFNYYFAATNSIIKYKTVAINQASYQKSTDSLWRNDQDLLQKMHFSFYKNDKDSVNSYPNTIQKDSLFFWFYNEFPATNQSQLSFFNDYNQFVKILNDSTKWIKITKDTLIGQNETFDIKKKYEFINRTRYNPTSDVITYYQTISMADAQKDSVFLPLKQYSIKYDQQVIQELIDNKDTKNISKLINNSKDYKYLPDENTRKNEQLALQYYIRLQIKAQQNKPLVDKIRDKSKNLSEKLSGLRLNKD